MKIINGPLPICPTIELTPDSIKLSVGPMSGIEITPTGVTIKGLMVSVKGMVETSVSGLILQAEGEAMASPKGPIVMIGP